MTKFVKKNELNNNWFEIDYDSPYMLLVSEVKKDKQISMSQEDKKLFGKSVFTLCELKEGQKCPPWTLQASKMNHDNISKTIYYENAVIKVYDIPIFYLPKLSHPDPSVNRRSGFLVPTISDSKNLLNENDETVKKIIDVLDTKIRPAVARDGGDIKFKSFENGVVKVELQGSCSGCPSSTATLKMGIENMLKHYVPEVQEVRPIDG